MKQKLAAALLSGALLATSVEPAGAVRLIDIAIAGGMAGASAVSGILNSDNVNAAPPVQDSQIVGFHGLEQRVRTNNQTVKSLELTAASVKGTNVKYQFDLQRESYEIQAWQYAGQASQYKEAMDGLQTQMNNFSEEEQDDPQYKALKAQYYALNTNYQMASGSATAMQSMTVALDSSEDDAWDDLDDTYVSTMKQVENTINMLVVSAQNAYTGLVTIRESLTMLDRNLEKIDRNIATVEKQIAIGAASQLTLDNLNQTRRTLVSSRDTLLQQQETTQNSLSLLLGNTAGTTVRVSELPNVTAKQLADMNFENDLAEAQKNSYSIWAKEDTRRTASDNYEDGQTYTLDAYNAAKEDLAAQKETVANSFRQLYNDVQEKQRLLEEAQADYDVQKKNFDVTALQYERGMVSKNDYLDAQDSLKEKEDAVTTAKHDLFSSYNTYDWAKRGYMS